MDFMVIEEFIKTIFKIRLTRNEPLGILLKISEDFP